MSKFLQILSLLLRIIVNYIDLFEAGWRIEVFKATYFDGSTEFLLVKHWWSRFLRGIRYCRGTEGVESSVCDECKQSPEKHKLLCPETPKETPDVD
jgi:hypothetical protein